jgi:hypothetical protein
VLRPSQAEDDAEPCPLCRKLVHGRAPKLNKHTGARTVATPDTPRTERVRRWDHLRKVHGIVTCDKVGTSSTWADGLEGGREREACCAQYPSPSAILCVRRCDHDHWGWGVCSHTVYPTLCVVTSP